MKFQNTHSLVIFITKSQTLFESICSKIMALFTEKGSLTSFFWTGFGRFSICFPLIRSVHMVLLTEGPSGFFLGRPKGGSTSKGHIAHLRKGTLSICLFRNADSWVFGMRKEEGTKKPLDQSVITDPTVWDNSAMGASIDAQRRFGPERT